MKSMINVSIFEASINGNIIIQGIARECQEP